jgi:3-oxoadipate enol-lactonase
MPKLAVPGGPVLAYDDSGGDGIPVLFSHGLFMNRRMFDPQVSDLCDTYRCVAWDERSHGDTEWKGAFSFWDSAEDLLALMDHLAIARAVLCGMSQGGLLSMRAALLAPERVAGLVMLDSQAGKVREESAPHFKAIADNWADDGPDDATLDDVAALILGPGTDQEFWKATWRTLPHDQPRDAVRAIIDREDLTDRLSEIKCPVLVIHGTADASTSMERAQVVADGVPDCRAFVAIDGAPHASNLSHPAEVNAALRTFIEGL